MAHCITLPGSRHTASTWICVTFVARAWRLRPQEQQTRTAQIMYAHHIIGARESLTKLTNAGHSIVVVTDGQSGVPGNNSLNVSTRGQKATKAAYCTMHTSELFSPQSAQLPQLPCVARAYRGGTVIRQTKRCRLLHRSGIPAATWTMSDDNIGLSAQAVFELRDQESSGLRFV